MSSRGRASFNIGSSLAAVFLVAGVLLTTSSISHGQSKPYSVGIIVGLTGAAPEYGDVMSKAFIMAIDDINAKGGVKGRPIKYILEDDNCSAKGAIAAYNKLVRVDKVKLIFGPICSNATLAIAPMLEEEKVIAFVTGGSDAITGSSRLLFRNVPPARVGAETLAPFVHKKHASVNLLTPKHDYAESQRKGFVKEYGKLGGTIKEDVLYNLNITDFRTEATKAMKGNPSAIVLHGTGEPDSGTIVKQLRELGYKGQIFGNDAAVTTGARKIAGDSAQGLVASVSPYIQPSNKKGTEVLTRFKQKHGYTSYEYYIAAGYDAPFIVAGCLAEIGEIDAEKLRACVLGLKKYEGAAGAYRFDDKGDPIGINNFIVQVDGGELRVLQD